MKKCRIGTLITLFIFCILTGTAYSAVHDWKDVKVSRVEADFLRSIPKTDIHIHLEGAFEPDFAWKLAKKYGYGPKNPLLIPKIGGGTHSVTSEEQLRKLYKFDGLLPFLNLYNALSEQLLRTPEDMTELAERFVGVCERENIVHVETLVDPQFHMADNKYRKAISFKEYIDAIQRGFDKGRAKGLSFQVIAAITRNKPIGLPGDSGNINSKDIKEPSAWNVLNCTVKYNRQNQNPSWHIPSIGLGGDEANYPCSLFKEIYEEARVNGLHTTAHAGEVPNAGSGTVTGPTAIWQAINDLKVDRLDHGIRSIEDRNLLNYLGKKHDSSHIIAAFGKPHKLPLTLCPLSNYDLKSVKDPTEACTLNLLDKGLMVSINSDDPAYLGNAEGERDNIDIITPGYVTSNYQFLMKVFNKDVTKTRPITKEDVRKMIINGFRSSFISEMEKQFYIDEVNSFFEKNIVESQGQDKTNI